MSYNKYQIVNIEYIKYIEKNIETVAIINAEKLEYNLKFADRSEINKLINAHCDETIFVKNNLLTDFSIGNIAIKYNDIWQTPTKPLLKGTTRERYLRSGFLQEQDISLNEFMNLFNNKNLEIAIINSMLDFKQLKIKKLVNQI